MSVQSYNVTFGPSASTNANANADAEEIRRRQHNTQRFTETVVFIIDNFHVYEFSFDVS